MPDRRVSSVLPWRKVAIDGVILHKERRALQRTYRVRGLPAQGVPKEQIGANMEQANRVLMRWGGDWVVHAEAQRVGVTTSQTNTLTHPVAGLLDTTWRKAVLLGTDGCPRTWETHYYLTLTWFPPSRPATTLHRVFVQEGLPAVPDTSESDKMLETFVAEADSFLDLLRGVLAVWEPLGTDAMLTYLHSCISDHWHPVKCPGSGLDIDVALADAPLVGGWTPQLGDWHLRVLSLSEYPAESFAHTMRALDSLALDYRWVTRWEGLEKATQDGLLHWAQRTWNSRRKGLLARLGEYRSGQEAEIQDSDAGNKAADVDAARQEHGADVVAHGQFSAMVVVWDTTPDGAEAKRRAVRQVLANQGITTILERQHSTAVWLGAVPGNWRDGVRRSTHNSLTLAHLLPGLQAVWSGPERDAYMQGPPWLTVPTQEQTLFRLVGHVEDLGHGMILGPTRAGKSVLVAWMVAQWFHQYARDGREPQCFWFDVDRSARLLTLLLGGHWHDLASGNVGIQVLRNIENHQERGWALQWLLNRCAEGRVDRSAEAQMHLSGGLRELATKSPELRTMSGLVTLLADLARQTQLSARLHPEHAPLVGIQHRVRAALLPYTRQGEYGWLFDRTEETDWHRGNLHTFEQRGILDNPSLAAPVLQAITHRVEQRFTTDHPTFLPMDEAALTWILPASQGDEDLSAYGRKGTEWLMATAKKGVSLWFATHSLSQVFSSPLGPLLLESCPTRLLLPNAGAGTEALAPIYRKLGCTTEDIETVSTMRPQRDVYYMCALLGKRRFSLPFPKLILDCIAKNKAEDHALMDEILQREGKEGFARSWLASQGYQREAAQVQTKMESCVSSSSYVESMV